MAIGDLPERVEVAEERIEQLEIHSVELENQIETVERILSEDEEDEDMDRGFRTPLSTPPPVYKEIQSPAQARTTLLHPVMAREAPLMVIPTKRRRSAGSEGVEKIEVQVGYKRGRRH